MINSRTPLSSSLKSMSLISLKQNRLAAHPHHSSPHVRATLQRRSRFRNAEKKNTWSNIQVCDNPETIGIGIMQHIDDEGRHPPKNKDLADSWKIS